MFKNPSNLLFSITLMMGSVISISANSWLGAWMGLEINLLSFMPLIICLKNSLSTESALKYYLTQTLGSAILLFGIMCMSMEINFNFYLTMNYSWIYWVMNSTLMMKMGAAPFHFWFPEMMEGLSWMSSFILMTWQKIAPMILLSYCLILKYVVVISILSIIIGSLGGLNQISLRKLMAYSSINHMGWLMSSLMISNFYWILYFMVYTFLSWSMISIFKKYNLFLINQLFNLDNFNPMVKISIFCNMLSLGGLPPFLGFMPKWILIQSLSIHNKFFVLIMVMFTLITLFFYMRLIYSALMINYTSMKWLLFNESNLNLILIFNFFCLVGLPMISLLYWVY
uniref:NADH-ubiquinone oxidoreductase chain 2 n=1 Tax=Neuronema laminatum TaxID=1701416 RepID=A0A0U2GJU1_NEULA|nr:NADH dehydrogenase subunit 2 [Neuronema laminatum]AKZ17613.1 NADH dehydrogenase subunit 2 [Neuronema laminatum]